MGNKEIGNFSIGNIFHAMFDGLFKKKLKKKLTSLQMAQALLSFYNNLFLRYIKTFRGLYGVNEMSESKIKLAVYEFDYFVFSVVYLSARLKMKELNTPRYEEILKLYSTDLYEGFFVNTFRDKPPDVAKHYAQVIKSEMHLRLQSYITSFKRKGISGISVLLSNITEFIKSSEEDDVDNINSVVKCLLNEERYPIRETFNWMPIVERIEFPLSIFDATSKEISKYLKKVDIII